MKRRIAIAAGAALAALGITACGGVAYEGDPRGLYEESYRMDDGRDVTCLVYSNPDYKEGGIACDFGGAR